MTKIVNINNYDDFEYVLSYNHPTNLGRVIVSDTDLSKAEVKFKRAMEINNYISKLMLFNELGFFNSKTKKHLN